MDTPGIVITTKKQRSKILAVPRNVTHLTLHVAQHEVQQEGLPLAEGSGHRHHHHIQVLHVILQQDLLQSCSIQLKTVLVLVGQHDLDRPGLRFFRHRLEIDAIRFLMTLANETMSDRNNMHEDLKSDCVVTPHHFRLVL